ncbi:hypothetical protein [uncultured Sunxiuqinia sp.]|uniref:hypothetical protein n=1 Tax=uncultured Sunxiuqinia sp. TaxID=1573825 RepID=UPI002AA78DE6|nr:hypothetical protein [uncultured Sunxiuqinia sp.]
MYGMLHTSTSTSYCIKGVYIIDPGNIVRSINSYLIEVGRNILEIERTIIALQIADNRKILPPANWEKGDDLLMKHYPYTDEELTNNPELELDYYLVGDRLWFKKEK